MSKQGKITSVYRSATPPFPTAIMANAFLMPMKDSIGVDDYYRTFYDIISDKLNDWYFYQEDIDRITPKVVEVLTGNPGLVEKCRDGYMENINRVNELLNRETLSERLAHMSGKEIIALLKEAAEKYRLASYYVEPPNFSLEIGGINVIKEKFRNYFKTQNITLKESEFEQYFSSLVGFTEMSFVQAEELSLLKIALLPAAARSDAIREHEQKYYWKFYDYYGPLLDVETINQELEPLLQLSRREIEARIQKITDSVKSNQQELLRNLGKYSLPPELRRAVDVIRNFGYLYSDIKKQHTSQASVGFGELIKFLAKKANMNAFPLHYATLEELIDLAGGKAPDEKILAQRVASGVSILRSPNRYYEFVNETEAKEIMGLAGKLEITQVSQLKGMPANSGFYTGPARVVINVSQIAKVQEGDVLVAPMTTVGYVPAMKKAGAIITDIGGITSHAAIVSRELGIPCIVGLKIATSSLKDGDIVEVNANHGMVRLIERK